RRPRLRVSGIVSVIYQRYDGISFTGRAAMLQLVKKLGEEEAFGPEDLRVLADAFDTAWVAVEASGAPFSEPDYRERAQEILAKSIIQAAKSGERDQRALSEGALLQLSKASMRRPRRNA